MWGSSLHCDVVRERYTHTHTHRPLVIGFAVFKKLYSHYAFHGEDDVVLDVNLSFSGKIFLLV